MIEQPYKVIAPEPVGPVDYALIRELVGGAWVTVGALWLHDGCAIGFDPHIDFTGTPTADGWYGVLRQAAKLGADPAKVWRYWSRYCNGQTVCVCGPVEQAANLDALRRKLGR